MAGQVNSWMGQINISPVPCIGDTVRKVSSTDVYANGGSSDPFAMQSTTDINGESSIQSASLWWLIAAGLAIGLLYKNSKRRQS